MTKDDGGSCSGELLSTMMYHGSKVGLMRHGRTHLSTVSWYTAKYARLVLIYEDWNHHQMMHTGDGKHSVPL
jgi:hypothetical protein